jgi:nucleotide-binding universal stress UspA family protein
MEDLMGLRDLIVYVDKSEYALSHLRLAVDLASRHESRLTALYVRERSQAQLEQRKTAELGLASAADISRLDHAIEMSIDRAGEELRSTLNALGRAHGVTTECRIVDGPAATVVPQHARYADLCVLGHYRSANDEPDNFSLSERLLFTSGRPVVSIPAGWADHTLGCHVAVAWNSSRAAARAVSDALPLLEIAERRTVITVNGSDFIGRNRGLPAEQMVSHLMRHGSAPTELIELENVPEGSIADALQRKACELGADVLVAGAFGQPRLWEKLFGGVTRGLLDHMSLPIVMSN